MNQPHAARLERKRIGISPPRNQIRRALCLCILLVGVYAPGGAARAPQEPAAAAATTAVSQTALTALQREIERERAMLTSSDQEERRTAVLRLGAFGRPESSRLAAAALNDSSAVVRATAARAVLSLPAAEAVMLLLPLLRDRDEFVRREVAYALGAVRDSGAVAALIDALENDKEAGVRGAAAVALGQIGDEAAVQALAQTVTRRIQGTGLISRITRRKKEENEFVRRAAARSLGEIRGRGGVPALIAALSDERAGDDVRREAARALGLIGDPAAIPALHAVLDARDPYLSRIAYEALRKLDRSKSTSTQT